MIGEDALKESGCCMSRCPKLKTLAVNIHGCNSCGSYFAKLPLPPGLVNLQLKLQAALPKADQLRIFWNALGAARSLTRLKVIFTAFDVRIVHELVRHL